MAPPAAKGEECVQVDTNIDDDEQSMSSTCGDGIVEWPSSIVMDGLYFPFLRFDAGHDWRHEFPLPAGVPSMPAVPADRWGLSEDDLRSTSSPGGGAAAAAAGRAPGPKGTTSPPPPPVFDSSLTTNVTAQLGNAASLRCKVLHIDGNAPVSQRPKGPLQHTPEVAFERRRENPAVKCLLLFSSSHWSLQLSLAVPGESKQGRSCQP